jgi:hypothetical protein
MFRVEEEDREYAVHFVKKIKPQKILSLGQQL